MIRVLHELVDQWGGEAPPGWENATVPQYLEAMAGWLADSDGYYEQAGGDAPSDGWVVMADALRAAAVYE
ncbi:MAG: hypothetical protein AB7O74_16180 [Candidatus Nanopelagicales bacterium]